MDVASGGSGSRRSGGGGGVVSGSVWERRMRSDQVKGGIKVFGIVDGLNDDDEDRGVKINRVGNLVKGNPTTVRKSRRTWRNHDESGKSLDLHPGKEFDEFEEVGGDKLCQANDDDDETCKELGVCHVGRVKSGSGQKVQHNGGNDDGGGDDGDEFFDDEGLEGDGFNDGNEVDLEKKKNGPDEIWKSCGTEQQRRKKVVSGDKKINNHFLHGGKPKSINVTKGSPPSGSGVHKEGRKQDSSELGGVLSVFILPPCTVLRHPEVFLWSCLR